MWKVDIAIMSEAIIPVSLLNSSLPKRYIKKIDIIPKSEDNNLVTISESPKVFIQKCSRI